MYIYSLGYILVILVFILVVTVLSCINDEYNGKLIAVTFVFFIS